MNSLPPPHLDLGLIVLPLTGGTISRTDVKVSRPDRTVTIATISGGTETQVVVKTSRDELGDPAAIRHLAAVRPPSQRILGTGQFDGIGWACLSFIPGEPLTVADRTACVEAGGWLRRIHQVPAPPHPLPYLPRMDDWVDDVTGWWRAIGGVSQALSGFLDAYQMLRPHLAGADTATILFDCRAEHFIVDPAGHLAGIIDVADTSRGDFAMDIAVISDGDQQLADQVLVGYRPTPAELEHVRAVFGFYTRLRHLSAAKWHDRVGNAAESARILAGAGLSA